MKIEKRIFYFLVVFIFITSLRVNKISAEQCYEHETGEYYICGSSEQREFEACGKYNGCLGKIGYKYTVVSNVNILKQELVMK